MITPQLLALTAADASDAESQGHLTDGVVAAIKQSGLYRQWVPLEYGGSAVTAVDGLTNIRSLSQGDGAAGWCLMIANTTSLLAHLLPASAASTIFADPDAITGGFAAPKGRAKTVGEALHVSGRWQWGSGTTHCTYIGGGCLAIDDSGEPVGPALFVFAPANRVEIIPTWDVMGLSGTGSNDYQMTDVEVPHEFAIEMGLSPAVVSSPLAHISFFGLLAAGVSAVAVGIADRAIQEVLAAALDRRPQGSSKSLAHRQTTQADVAQARATIDSTWGLLTERVQRCWDDASRTGENSPLLRAELRLAATDATQRCAEVVRSLYLLGGGEAVYRRGVLQKQFRDIHVATQHAMVAERTYEIAGRVLLGLDTDTRFI